VPELGELERVIGLLGKKADVRVAARLTAQGAALPVYTVALGNPGAPAALGLFGGVHGLERIGSDVVITWLHSLAMRLPWDVSLHALLERVRLVFMPIVNPGGMLRGTRANPQGVDLMRNAPVDARERVPFLLGGQRISAGLPWYRGRLGAPMEPENQAVCKVVEEELLSRRFSMAIDCHSGFGVSDRIWFPYAHTARPIEHLAEVHALKTIFDQSHLHHRYVVEPQSRQYLAHGDLWDHLYQRACQTSERTFLPLTLEMGSWLWVKKNPRQLFSRHGMFNPLIEHRQQRVLRTHVGWLDFVARAVCSHERWVPSGAARERHREQALAQWYRRAAGGVR
jgi:Zinc carboxypeptidase